MTSVVAALGFCASIAWYDAQRPDRSSASNQPPTVITAG